MKNRKNEAPWNGVQDLYVCGVGLISSNIISSEKFTHHKSEVFHRGEGGDGSGVKCTLLRKVGWSQIIIFSLYGCPGRKSKHNLIRKAQVQKSALRVTFAQRIHGWFRVQFGPPFLQESIPVGCVLPAFVVPGGGLPRGCRHWGKCPAPWMQTLLGRSPTEWQTGVKT